MSPGAKVTLSVQRKGEQKSIALTLKQMPNDKQAKADTGTEQQDSDNVPHLGLTLAPANQVEGAGSKGMVVTGIESDGAAAEHGLQTGDVILDGRRQVGVERPRYPNRSGRRTEERPVECADAGEVG